MRFSLIALNCRYTHSCLSLYYVRNKLHSSIPGCSAAIHDFTINDPYYDTLLRITGLKDDALFFSAYIWNTDYLLRLVQDISLVKPYLPIIIGGPQVSALQENTLPSQCILVHGEVEGLDKTFYQDLQASKMNRSYQGGSMKPFDFPYTEADFQETLAERSIYYESSRGCPYSCSYCLSSADKKMVNKDIETVKKELAALMSCRPRIIRFVDRTFNASAGRALALWKYLADQGGETTFHFEIAPDLFDEEMFSFLENVRPRLFQFEIGVQSTNRETLRAVNRKMDIGKTVANIGRLMRLDTIHLHVDLILGLPHETMESFAQSFNDIFKLLPHYVQMGLLKVLPHTPIREKTDAFRMKYCAHPPYQVLETKWLSHEELTRLYWFGECVEAFYNTRFFRAFFRFIQKKANGFDFFSELLERCLKRGFFQRAKTQDLMSSILVETASDKYEKQVVREILKYDWLRTGNRFLPDFLRDEPLKKEKDRLWKELPHDYPPYYTRQTRNAFFKQCLFAAFSQHTLEELGMEEGEKRTVCFLAEKEDNVLQLQKAFLLC